MLFLSLKYLNYRYHFIRIKVSEVAPHPTSYVVFVLI